MRKNCKYFALLGVALLGCGLSACSADDDDDPDFNRPTNNIIRDTVLIYNRWGQSIDNPAIDSFMTPTSEYWYETYVPELNKTFSGHFTSYK